MSTYPDNMLDILERYKKRYPTASLRRLAQLIHEQEAYGKNSNSVRTCLMALIGKKKNEFKDIKLLSDTKKPVTIGIESEYEKPKIIKLPNYKKGLIIADVHIPFHSVESLDVAINHALRVGVDFIVLLGDIGDFIYGSRFIKKPKHNDAERELMLIAQFLRNLRAIFPDAAIYYKMGNHERRFVDFLLGKAPQLFNLLKDGLPNYLEFEKYDITEVGYQDFLELNNYYFGHGHEFDAGGGISPARTRGLKSFVNLITAHSHVSTSYKFERLDGTVSHSYTIGCSCGLRPDWSIVNQWNNGYGIFHNDEIPHFENIEIRNGFPFEIEHKIK